MTLPAAVLAEARAELEVFDAVRFLTYGDRGVTRGLAPRPRPVGLVGPSARRPRAARPARQAEPPDVVREIPALRPCPGGCGRSISAKTHKCAACRMASWGPHRCKGAGGAPCPRVLTTCHTRCASCTRRHHASQPARCPCGRPVRCRGLCEVHYKRSRREADHTVRAAWLERKRRARARRRQPREAA